MTSKPAAEPARLRPESPAVAEPDAVDAAWDAIQEAAPAPPQNGRASDPAPLRADPRPEPMINERLAPQAIEAEQSVLGSILIDDACLDRVLPIIAPDSFYRLEHGHIYTAMLALHATSTPIDLVTLGDELRRRDQLAGVGGPGYLTSLMNVVPTALHAEHYARIVAYKALSRRAIVDAGRIAAIGYEDSNDPEELLARLQGLVEGITGSWTLPSAGIAQRLGARLLTTISTEPPDPLLVGRLDPFGHSILYGTGGVGKGTLASSWLTALLEDSRRILIVDYENHPDEWARRISGLGAGELAERVLHVAPLTAAWRGRRGAIWDQAADLRRLAIDFAADYVAIDSAVTACAGADPMKPETVSLYAGALEYIGLPALTLAHVTKADDLRYPFGSIFWHNLARITYSLKAAGPAVLLTHRKHNNYAKEPARQVVVTWDPTGGLREVWERDYSDVLRQRISSALREGAMTASQITGALNEELDDEDAEPIKATAIARVLRRGSQAKPTPHFVKATEGGGRGREASWRNG